MGYERGSKPHSAQEVKSRTRLLSSTACSDEQCRLLGSSRPSCTTLRHFGTVIHPLKHVQNILKQVTMHRNPEMYCTLSAGARARASTQATSSAPSELQVETWRRQKTTAPGPAQARTTLARGTDISIESSAFHARSSLQLQMKLKRLD